MKIEIYDDLPSPTFLIGSTFISSSCYLPHIAVKKFNRSYPGRNGQENYKKSRDKVKKDIEQAITDYLKSN